MGDLRKEIEERSREVFTDSFSLSLSELSNRYKEGDIIIPPKLQRVFRWSKYQKSRLIESLLLKIPIPAIFVSEDDQQRFEIIDGLQRMSTIFEFMGELQDSNVRYPISGGLINGEYLSLEGITRDSLDDEWKRRIKNTRITLNIIQKDSNPKAKFDLFGRLNDGGSALSSQETRNCIMLMTDESFYDWILELSENPNYKNVMNFSEKSLEVKDNMEFVIRYLCSKFYNESLDSFSDVKTFLDSKIKFFIEDNTFNRDEEEQIFQCLFKKLDMSLSDKAFHKFTNSEFTNRFNYPGFDTIAQGLAYNFGKEIIHLDNNKLKETIKNMWSDEFNKNTDTKSGASSENKFKYCANYGKTYFSNITLGNG